MRLQQIKQPFASNTYSGNICVLAVGDFFQIPSCFSQPLVVDSHNLTDLWGLFSVWELTDVVRKKGGSRFTVFLNRMRVRKDTDPLQDEDIDTLNSRLISHECKDYPYDLHLFTRNNDTHKHNQSMLTKLSEENKTAVWNIPALDICLMQNTNKTFGVSGCFNDGRIVDLCRITPYADKQC